MIGAQSKKFTWIFVFFLFVAVVLFAANAGTILVLNAPVRSDVIVVLAGETDLRPSRGLELLREGYGRRLLINVPAQTKIYDLTQVQLAQNYVRSLAEADSIAICPIEGLSTRDESRDVERCLPQDGNRVLLVTSEFHTRRALSIFRHELKGKVFSVAIVRDDKQFGTRWWLHREWAKTCVDEWLRVIWWYGVDRWR